MKQVKQIKFSNPDVKAFSKECIEAIVKFQPVNGIFSVRSLSLSNCADKVIAFNVNFPHISDKFTIAKSMHVYWYTCELRKLEKEYGESAKAYADNPTDENKLAHTIIGERLDSIKPYLQEIANNPYLKWVEPFVNADRLEGINAYTEALRNAFEQAKSAIKEEFENSQNTKWSELKDKLSPFTIALWDDNKPDCVDNYTFNANATYAKEIFAMFGGKYEKSKEGFYSFVRASDEKIIANLIKGAVKLLHEKYKVEQQNHEQQNSKKKNGKRDSKKEQEAKAENN